MDSRKPIKSTSQKDSKKPIKAPENKLVSHTSKAYTKEV
jgi:hypothetical protein